MYASAVIVFTTGAALLENNEASAKLTTAYGGTFIMGTKTWVVYEV